MEKFLAEGFGKPPQEIREQSDKTITFSVDHPAMAYIQRTEVEQREDEIQSEQRQEPAPHVALVLAG